MPMDPGDLMETDFVGKSTATSPDPDKPEPTPTNKYEVGIVFPPGNVNETFGWDQDDFTVGQFLSHCKDDWPQCDVSARLIRISTDRQMRIPFTNLGVKWEKAKVMVMKPKPGIKRLLKASDDGDYPLINLHLNTVRLMVPLDDELKSLASAEQAAILNESRRAQRAATFRTGLAMRTKPRQSQEDSAYTFHHIRVLESLPRAERSREFLHRLRDDPGIRAAMKKHKFSVGILMEMDPASNTSSSHEGTTRLLGLNRNQGEVIELRLRTDAYDGYRDYKASFPFPDAQAPVNHG
jgi:hypothetical protein